MEKIKIGICGYGHLGRGVEAEICKNPDMELAAIFTRRPAESLKIKAGVPTVHVEAAAEWKGKVDVMIMCGGSKSDLPAQVPEFAKSFSTVDSFDTHAKIPAHFEAVDKAAKAGGNIAVISAGWDPGLFSLMRLYAGAIIPAGSTQTFWGAGVSQGHSEAIRGIEGVDDAVQYTIPVPAALEKVRSGEAAGFTAREKHTRLCYVVAGEGADRERIESEIKDMPDYFADYDTTVRFIAQAELDAEHSKLMHGGNVIHTGKTGAENTQVIELSLKLYSNPEFTASVLLAYARAAYRLSARGESGARTVFDIPPVLLPAKEPDALIRELM